MHLYDPFKTVGKVDVPAGVSLAQQSSNAARASSSDPKGIRCNTASAHALEWQHLTDGELCRSCSQSILLSPVLCQPRFGRKQNPVINIHSMSRIFDLQTPSVVSTQVISIG